MMRLVITDLDNTLYDWVTYYARSFESMVACLSQDLRIDESLLLDEFKTIHQAHGDSEYPFAALELPSVRAVFPGASREVIARNLARSFQAFNDTRDKHLKLYGEVESTLRRLSASGIVIVGHTEAMVVNAVFRLRFLKILPYFTRLYALEGRVDPHPLRPRRLADAIPGDLVETVPRSERKPNPVLLGDICARQGCRPAEACYVGDSLTRDIAMAKAAGVTSIWARYGTRYERARWETLVRVTHWTDEDVSREAALRERAAGVVPDHSIDSFDELEQLVLDAG